MTNSSDYDKDATVPNRRLPKESALDPYRIARRLTSVLGWTYASDTKAWHNRGGISMPLEDVKPLLLRALKTEIDSNRLLGPEGYAARIGRDIDPTDVLDMMLAIAHDEVRSNG